jgi:hypothetical protein
MELKMDKVQALTAFWNSFGLPAYDDASVPDKAAFPYITFNVATDSLGNVTNLTANVWYRSTSLRDITHKVEEISKAISYSFKTLPFDGGYIYMTRGTPFAQRMDDPDDNLIKRYYINVQAEYLCAD